MPHIHEPPRISMARSRFKADEVAIAFKPYGFKLNLRETHRGGISFIRFSKHPRLYEHIRISSENPVYAQAVVSAATYTSCHAFVSAPHDHLRQLLSANEFGTTQLASKADTAHWQARLIENADFSARQASAELGPALAAQLASHFHAVDRYVQHVGDLAPVFDREFAFINDATDHELAEIERLAPRARRNLYLDLDDSALASLIITRYASTVESNGGTFAGKLPHNDTALAIRLVLLTDYIQQSRMRVASQM